jgi:hypothetical protein
VLTGLKRGDTYQQIADDLGLSYDTVKYHVSNMLAKAGVNSREQLVRYAGRPGLRWLAVPALWGWFAGAAAVAVIALAAMAVLATRGADEPATPDGVPTVAAAQTVQATPTGRATPTARASGVPVVDEFIAAVLSGDMTNIEPLIDYQPVPCSNEQGIGAPPACPPGQPEGAPIPALLLTSCEGSYVTKSEMPALLARTDLGFDGVFSVARVPANSGLGGAYATARYAAVLTFTQWANGTPVKGVRPGMQFLLSDQGALGWGAGCGDSARAMALRFTDYIVPPPPIPPAPADTPHTGIAAVDSVIDALVTSDVVNLAQRTGTIDVGCGADRWLPSCPPGKPAGTLVSAIIRDGCERTWAGPVVLSSLARDYDFRLGPTPRIVAVAKGDGADGVGYWLVFDGSVVPDQRDAGRALGVTETGQIAVINGGCSQTAADLAATFSEFLISPR